MAVGRKTNRSQDPEVIARSRRDIAFVLGQNSYFPIMDVARVHGLAAVRRVFAQVSTGEFLREHGDAASAPTPWIAPEDLASVGQLIDEVARNNPISIPERVSAVGGRLRPAAVQYPINGEPHGPNLPFAPPGRTLTGAPIWDASAGPATSADTPSSASDPAAPAATSGNAETTS